MMNEVEALLNNEVIRSNMCFHSEIDKMYEYLVAKNDMEEFIEFLRKNCNLLQLFQDIFIKIEKMFKLYYCYNSKDLTAANMFAGMISGYLTENKLKHACRLYSIFNFDNTNFKCQYNLDLACKIIENKITEEEKAEAIAILNDIKERLTFISSY